MSTSPLLIKFASEALEERVAALYGDPNGYFGEIDAETLPNEFSEIEQLADELGMDYDKLLNSNSSIYERERIAKITQKFQTHMSGFQVKRLKRTFDPTLPWGIAYNTIPHSDTEVEVFEVKNQNHYYPVAFATEKQAKNYISTMREEDFENLRPYDLSRELAADAD